MSNFDLSPPSVNTILIRVLDGMGKYLGGEAQVQLQAAIAVIQDQDADITAWKGSYTAALAELKVWQQQCKDTSAEMWKITGELEKARAETEEVKAEVTRCKQNASFWCNAATSHLQERNEAYTALTAANDFISTSIPPANSGSVLEWNQWCDKHKKAKKLIDAVLNPQKFG